MLTEQLRAYPWQGQKGCHATYALAHSGFAQIRVLFTVRCADWSNCFLCKAAHSKTFLDAK